MACQQRILKQWASDGSEAMQHRHSYSVIYIRSVAQSYSFTVPAL